MRHQRRVQDEFVEIDWDLIKDLDDAATLSEVSTDLDVPSTCCLDDRTIAEEEDTQYDMNDDEKFHVFLGLMCDMSFGEDEYENDALFNTVVVGISKNIQKVRENETNVGIQLLQTQDVSRAASETTTQAEFTNQSLPIPQTIEFIPKQLRIQPDVAAQIH